jgi:hypothetical protein
MFEAKDANPWTLNEKANSSRLFRNVVDRQQHKEATLTESHDWPALTTQSHRSRYKAAFECSPTSH